VSVPTAAGGTAMHSLTDRAVSRLPRELRDELNRRLTAGSFSNYASLSVWLRKQGYNFSLKSITKYGGKLEQRLEAVRLATAQARAVVEATDGDDLKLNEGLLRLVQQHLFAVLMEINPDPKQQNLTTIARSVAEMGRASIMQKKYAEELRNTVKARLTVAACRVVDVAKATGGGLTPEAEAEIRRTLMEVTQ
jgi:uncharacterized protein YutE (UPF0331/DUF86 family)